MQIQLHVKPDRRLRPETLLRLLIATSYPHNTLSNLVIALSNGLSLSNERLEEVSNALNAVEKEYDMLDFVRCIELRRDTGHIKVIAKCLHLDPNSKSIVDNSETHYVRFNIDLYTNSINDVVESSEQVSKLLLNYFSRSQSKLGKHVDVDAIEWSSKCKSLIKNITTQEVLTILEKTLSLSRFNIVLTQSAILLPDQRLRLWGSFKENRNV